MYNADRCHVSVFDIRTRNQQRILPRYVLAALDARWQRIGP